MKKEEKSSLFQLSTGRTFYANDNIIGICEPTEEEGWVIFDGYDGTIFSSLRPNDSRGQGEEPYTPAELTEIADYMIALWQRFRAEMGE